MAVRERRRPEVEKKAWRRRLGHPRLDSAHGEVEEKSAELVAASVCFEAAGFNGVRDGGGRRAGARVGLG